MTHRTLPPEEWNRLSADPELVALLDPRLCEVVVVEDGDEILGFWIALSFIHAEAPWVHPDHRKRAAVVRHLVQGMRELITERGAHGAICGVTTENQPLLEKLGGVPFPPTYYVPMKESASCHH